MGPPGPGPTPMTTPAAGAGNEAAADGLIKALIPALHKALGAYQIGSKKYAAVLNAIRALTANFGKENQQSLVPSAIMQLAQASRGQGLPRNPPPPIAPVEQAEPPGGMPGGGPMGGAAGGMM